MKTRIKNNSQTKFRRVHLNMIETIVAYALSITNVVITDSITAFRALINRLRDGAVSIENLDKLSKSPITGFAAQRNTMRALVTEITLGIMGATKNYGVAINDDVLVAKMTITRSALNSMSLAAFMARVGDAIEVATPISGNLEDYGVDIIMINTWMDNYNTLRTMNTNPTTAITNRKLINANIQQQLRQCINLLYEQCDVMVLQLKAQYPDFVTGWFYNRKLRPNGHVVTKLRAIVENELQEPIEGATVMVVGMDNSSTSDVNGECTIDGVPFGSHQVVIISGGNSKTFGPYQFKKGQSRTIHFTMTPSFVAPDQVPSIVTSKEKVK